MLYARDLMTLAALAAADSDPDSDYEEARDFLAMAAAEPHMKRFKSIIGSTCL